MPRAKPASYTWGQILQALWQRLEPLTRTAADKVAAVFNSLIKRGETYLVT